MISCEKTVAIAKKVNTGKNNHDFMELSSYKDNKGYYAAGQAPTIGNILSKGIRSI